MSSGYSEEDIRRAAEIREWLIKEISDRQEEVERLRTTLSIIDNLLKQGSFRAAANLGIATTAATSAQTEPAATTGAAAATAAATMAQVHQQAARQTRASSSSSTPTLRSSPSGSGIDDNDNRNIKPLKRVKDEFLLANAEISSDAVIIVPAPDINLNSNTPPFRSFFLNRILEGMKGKDSEKVNQGVLRESDALNYRVEEEGGGGSGDNASGSSSSSGSGIINRIVINNYRDKERLQEIFNTSTWVFTRMLEKSGKSS